MKRIAILFLVAVALVPWVAGEAAAESAVINWPELSSVAGYEEATAHEPQFQNKALWPNVTGKENFVTQKWPAGRVYVWAHPGEGSKDGKMGKHDFSSPASWLENGKTPSKVVFDELTDLVFPGSATRYAISTGSLGGSQIFRSITIGRNCNVSGGGDGRGRQIFGNVWVKRLGGLYAQGGTRILGKEHSFIRNDNVQPANKKAAGSPMISQYIGFLKANGASVETLGWVSVLDEFQIQACTVVVGQDSILQPGRNAFPVINNGGILALMDGAQWSKWANELHIRDLDMTGIIQGGLPDRPLTRNASFRLQRKNHPLRPLDAEAEQYLAKPKIDEEVIASMKSRTPSLIMQKGSGMRTYSTDLSKARLVVTWSQLMSAKHFPDPTAEATKQMLATGGEQAVLAKWFTTLPSGISIWMAPGTQIDGVEFDYVHKGGLALADMAMKSSWKNVFFGPNCLATGDDLFSHVPQLTKAGY